MTKGIQFYFFLSIWACFRTVTTTEDTDAASMHTLFVTMTLKKILNLCGTFHFQQIVKQNHTGCGPSMGHYSFRSKNFTQWDYLQWSRGVQLLIVHSVPCLYSVFFLAVSQCRGSRSCTTHCALERSGLHCCSEKALDHRSLSAEWRGGESQAEKESDWNFVCLAHSSCHSWKSISTRITSFWLSISCLSYNAFY